jgi:hypothetical protein
MRPSRKYSEGTKSLRQDADSSPYRCRTSTILKIVVHSIIDKELSWSHCMGQATRTSDLCESLRADLGTVSCIGILQGAGVTHHIHAAILPLDQHLTVERVTLQEIIDIQSGAGFQIKQK